MSTIESPLPYWLTLPDLEAQGVKTSSLRFDFVSDDSQSIHGQEQHIADLLKNVLVNGYWREYIPTWISRGPYGNDRKVCYEDPSKTVVRHKSLEEWIENGLRLRFPDKKSPLDRLILRIQTVLPEKYHAELIAVVRQAAAISGRPMSLAEQRALAGSGNRNPDETVITSNDRRTESIANQNSQSRHLAELETKAPELFEEVVQGNITLNAARIKAGLRPKDYAFNSTTKPQKLASHIMVAYSDQPDKMVSLLCTLLSAHAHDRWHPEQLSAILNALSCPVLQTAEDAAE